MEQMGPVDRILQLGPRAKAEAFREVAPETLERDLPDRDPEQVAQVVKVLAEGLNSAVAREDIDHLTRLLEAAGQAESMGEAGAANMSWSEHEDNADRFMSGVSVKAGPAATEGPVEDPATPDRPDPLMQARGRAVLLDDLLSLGGASGGDRLSDPVRGILRQSTQSPQVRFGTDGQAFVTARAFWDRLLALDAEQQTEQAGTAIFLSQWMKEAGLIEPERARWTADVPKTLDHGVAADLMTILAEAARILGATLPGQTRVDLRHVVAAFLTTPEGRQAITDELVQDHPPLRQVFLDLRDAVRRHILEQAARTETADGWGEVLSVVDLPSSVEGLRPRSVTVQLPFTAIDYVGRNDESVGYLGNDSLNLAPEARALADLVSLRASPPPLAIGIFGNWGSGKSYFMKMLQEAIRENQRRAPSLFFGSGSGSESGSPEPVYWENVVHIEFNAWQYLDTNLWASLVNHIFRELSRKASLPGGTPSKDLLEKPQIQSLVGEMALVQGVAEAAKRDLSALEQTIDDVTSRIDALQGEETRLQARLEQARVAAGAGMVSGAAKTAFARLGMPEMAGTLATLGDVGQQTRLAGNRVGLLLSSSAGPDGRRFLLWGAGIFVGLTACMAALTYGAAHLSPDLAAVISRAGVAISALGGLAAWLLPHLKFINEQIGNALAEEDAIRIEQARTRAERDALAEKMEILHEQVASETERLRDAQQKQIRLQKIASGAEPEELLARFIEDRAGIRGYRKHLGLLSEIRNDFERLSQLMARQRDKDHFNENLPRIERIVLYIDDLDRCRDERVVEVLEAIHLLLAFDLFVVVVAVDARWLDTSVQRFYSDHLRQSADDTTLPSAADYLEKIFQIPYRLPKLTGANQKSYRGYVDALVGPVVMTAQRPGDDGTGSSGDRPDAGTGTETGPDTGSDTGAEADKVADKVADATKEMTYLVSPVIEDTETVLETLQRVQLTDQERKAIRGMGCLPGMSPRTTKRFVNLYRLMRSRKRATALEAWLAAPEFRTARFKVAMLWLAFECGLRRGAMAELTEALRDDAMDRSLPEFFGIKQGPGRPDAEGDTQAVYRLGADSILRRMGLDGEDHAGDLIAMIGTMTDVLVSDLRAQAAEAGRYSFRIED